MHYGSWYRQKYILSIGLGIIPPPNKQKKYIYKCLNYERGFAFSTSYL